jgi:glyoxylase-like metal-dependent hydrolase (beta-lactamase superfamily II)
MQISKNLHAFIWKSITANNCNTYLIEGPTRILIDPGHIRMFDHVKKGLQELGLGIEDIGLILGTHAHPDHVEAVQTFTKTPALTAIHEKEWQWLKSMQPQIEATFGLRMDSISPDFFLKEGDISIAGLDLRIIHTPGHSPGSVSIFWPAENVLFTGDLIFKEGLGRTDLPGGDGTILKESIKRLSDLDAEWLLPGHGDVVAGKSEVRANFDQVEQLWFAYI